MGNFINKCSSLWIAVRFVLLFSICGLVTIAGCRNSEQDDLYIMPYQFSGKAKVFFRETNGVPVKFAGRKHVFEIPQSGILLTKGTPNYGYYHANRFFRRLPNGRLLELPDYTYAEVNPQILTNPNFVMDSVIVKDVKDSTVIGSNGEDMSVSLSFAVSRNQ